MGIDPDRSRQAGARPPGRPLGQTLEARLIVQALIVRRDLRCARELVVARSCSRPVAG